jgi:hypothetical protein
MGKTQHWGEKSHGFLITAYLKMFICQLFIRNCSNDDKDNPLGSKSNGGAFAPPIQQRPQPLGYLPLLITHDFLPSLGQSQ